MKRLFLILAISIQVMYAFAAKYYVSNLGNDSNNGTSSSSPWKTISKVNAEMNKFNPGDQILFKRGDIFEGQITISASGSAGQYLTFGSYGTGELPIIKGTKKVENWTSFSFGIYKASVNGFPDRITNLFANEKSQPLSRYPNNTWRKTTSGTDDKHLQDATLDFPDGYWNGADAVVRMARWIIDAVPIQSHTGGVINFAEETTYGIDEDWGYFFQNHVNAIDLDGEWAFDNSNDIIYFKPESDVDPNDLTFEATYYDFGVLAEYEDYLRIENLAFFSPRSMGIKIEGSEYIQVENVEVLNSGGNGIQLEYCNYAKVNNCEIRDCANNGVNFESCDYSEFTNSLIKNAALIPGRGGNYNAQYLGFKLDIGTDVLIANNVLDSIGYCGINFFSCSRTIIQNNFVNNTCLVKDDGGGIYTWGNKGKILDEDDLDNRQQPENKVIGNIVLNSIGNTEGISEEESHYWQALGIYIDDYTHDIEIIGNTVSNCSEGLFVHNSNTITMRDNLLYNNKQQLYFRENMQNWDIYDCVISNNQLVSDYGSEGQVCMRITSTSNFLENNLFDSNYICNPFYDVIVERFYVPEGGNSDYPESDYLDLAGWQALGQGAHSKDAVIKWEDAGLTNKDDFILFEYNASDEPKEVQLYNAYRDKDNNLVYGIITLEPFSGIVLYRDTKAILMETNNPTGKTALCQGEEGTSTYTTETVSGASHYNWSIYPANAGTIEGSGNEADVIWNSEFSGTATIGVTACSLDGCGIPSEPLEVIITPTPTANFDLEVLGNNLQLENKSSTHTSREWNFGDGNSSTENEPSHQYDKTGEFEVTLKVKNNGCYSALATKTATVITTAQTPSGDTTMCQGETLSSIYTTEEVNGATSYDWNITPSEAGDIEEDGAEATITWNSDYTGQLKISVKACYESNCGTGSNALTVNIKPTPTADFNLEVSENNLQLENNSSTHTSCEWNFGDGNSSTEHEPTHQYDKSGDFEVTLKVENNGCYSALSAKTATVTITAQTPVGDSIICQGETDTSAYATEEVSGAISYDWNISPSEAGDIAENGTEATATWNPNYTGLVGISVKACYESGCGTESKPLSVNIKPTPIASFETDVNEQDIKITNKSLFSTHSKWDFDDGNYSTDKHPEHRYAINGMYVIKLDVENNGCKGSAAHDTIHIKGGVNATSIMEKQTAHLKLYPNPSNGAFTISLANEDNEGIIKIYNLQGSLIFNNTFKNYTSEHSFNLSWLEKGAYIVNIVTKQNMYQTIMTID